MPAPREEAEGFERGGNGKKNISRGSGVRGGSQT